MSETPNFTVLMHPTLVDQLDEQLSPMDGIVAIDEMFLELPKLHRPVPKRSRARRSARRLKVYRGLYAWSGIGFSYVQLGTELHVIELWDEGDQHDKTTADVVLGQTSGGH